MEALERIGSPDAQQVLETLGQGAPDAGQTGEVKAALRVSLDAEGAIAGPPPAAYHGPP